MTGSYYLRALPNVALWMALFIGGLLLHQTNPTTPELAGSALLGLVIGIAATKEA